MTRMLKRPVLGVLVVVMGGLASPAVADQAKSPPTAAMILGIMSGPLMEQPQVAFDRSLMEEGPRPAVSPTGEVLPDGSVRYGRVTVTVKNPCPPGTPHYEPPSLPGRRDVARDATK